MQGRADDVLAAYDRYIEIRGPADGAAEGLGEMLGQQMFVTTGTATGATEELFHRVLELNPGNRTAQIFNALAITERGETEAAEAAWLAIIAEEPPGGADWANIAREQLAALRGATGDLDQAALAAMTPDELTAFMTARADQLAAELAANPLNPEGWGQLIRSYLVLERLDDARTAVAAARTAYANDANGMAAIETAVLAAPTAILAADQTDARAWAQLIRSYNVLGRIAEAQSAIVEARTALAANTEGLMLVDAAARELEQ
jgi:cytochrome c-type biogenesis protein CcmH